MAEDGVDHGHDPTSEPTFEGAPSASGLHASPSPTTTTLPTRNPAAATSTPITGPPIAEGTGFPRMPTYPAYGVDPSTTAFPDPTTASEPVASSSAPRWYAADYHHHILYPLREPILLMSLGMQRISLALLCQHQGMQP